MRIVYSSRWIVLVLLTFLVTFAPVLTVLSSRCAELTMVCPYNYDGLPPITVHGEQLLQLPASSINNYTCIYCDGLNL